MDSELFHLFIMNINNALENLIHEAINRNENLFILFLDLDGLKSVNDRYGHDEGDSFIKAMGTILCQLHGKGELVMRYGGDEFVVMSRNYTDEKAVEYIRRIQRSIDEYNTTSGKEYKLGDGMGYSLVVPEEDMKLEDLIEEADQEMYKVKKPRRKS